MSGFEVLRSLRISKVKTPTLILSGLGGIEDKVRGFGVGADDYMINELVARIHAIVAPRATPSLSFRPTTS